MAIYRKHLGRPISQRVWRRYRLLSSPKDLASSFFICQILKKGEVQVGEKEREHDLTSLRKEIATLVAAKCVDPETQTPYPVGMIEKAMSEAHFSVKQNKTAKSQVIITYVCIIISNSCRYLNALNYSNPTRICQYNERACVLE
jgi:hypothetical protein